MKKYIAECVGTFVLVFFACGTAAVTGCSVDANSAYAVTALAFGLSIVAMAYSIGNISGCHVNPAVSLAMYVSGKLSLNDLIGYVIAQFVGGIAGAGVLAALTKKAYGLGTNGLYDGSIFKTMIIEIILTFVFVFAIMGVTSKEKYSSVAGLVIGLTLTLVHLPGIFFSGTSVNPARSFGPALFMGGDALKCVWVFIVAPLIGGVLAAMAYSALDE